MNRTMITATNTLGQLQQQLDLISNNMSNVNTVGYKRQESNFTEMLYQQFNNQPKAENEVGRLTPNGIRIGVGAKVGHTSSQFTMGSLKQTDNPLDVALTNPNHFFRVRTTSGNVSEIGYTRNGELKTSVVSGNPNIVQVVTGDGNALLDKNGKEVYIPANYKQLSIQADGSIYASTAEGYTVKSQLDIVNIVKPQLLEKKGANVYGLPNLQALNYNQQDVVRPVNAGEGSLKQGMTEQSNVDLAQEMTNLTMTQRAYQFNSRAITMADEMSGLVNNLR